MYDIGDALSDKLDVEVSMHVIVSVCLFGFESLIVDSYGCTIGHIRSILTILQRLFNVGAYSLDSSGDAFIFSVGISHGAFE
jgi:hypothetical protein